MFEIEYYKVGNGPDCGAILSVIRFDQEVIIVPTTQVKCGMTLPKAAFEKLKELYGLTKVA